MNKSRILAVILVVLLVFMPAGSRVTAQEPDPPDPIDATAAIGSGFTYQGQLKNSAGDPLTDTCAFQFALYDAATVGTKLGGTSTVAGVSVTNGYFAAKVNPGGEFGSSAFNGQARWLEIAVKCSADTSYTTLTPRQELTLAPYAAYALKAGSVAWSGLTGIPNLQARVSGTCAVGSTIRAINYDGSVVCQWDAPFNRAAPPMANLNTSLDSISGGDTGQHTSITIGADGLPVISYYDVTNQELRVARCANVDCSGSPTLNTVDSAGNVGMFSSIIIGTDGLPVISYFDATNGHLKVAHCEDASCNSATLTAVATNPTSGQYTSIIIAGDGLPIISYYLAAAVGTFPMVAHCSNVTCSAAEINQLDASAGTGQYTSIGVTPSGLAAVSYYDISNGNLKYAYCSNFACSSPSALVVDNSANDVGKYSSLVFGSDGLPIISYYDATAQKLKAAHCADATCSSATINTLSGSFGNYGLYTSITIGSDGLPVISSYNAGAGNGVRLAHCGDVACSRADIYAPANGPSFGQYTAITIGVDGLPLISFYDGGNFSLRTLHCANNLCVSNLRHR